MAVKNNAQNENKKYTGILLTMLLLFAIAIFAIVFRFIIPNTQNSNFKTFNLQRISTDITSADGANHTLNTDISLKVTKDSNALSSSKSIQNEVKDLLSTLDFDKITGVDGIVYIRQEIQGYLKDNYPDENLEDVYVTAFISDHDLPPGTNPSQRDDVFNGLFQNPK